MNTIDCIDIDYLRPSRTIETVLVSSKNKEKVFFIYNYEGISFRLFNSHSKLIDFFKDEKTQEDFAFDTEQELDDFLSNVFID